MIFVTYIRVLKNAPHARILPAILDVSMHACCSSPQGLSMFAHLIDVSFYSDLMAVLLYEYV